MSALVTPINKKFQPWIAEEEILSAMAQSRQKLLTFINDIDPDFFNSSDCKNLFKMMKFYFEKYSSIPKKTAIISSVQKLMASQEKGSNVSSTIFATIDRVFDRKELTEDELEYFHDELLKFIKTGKIRDVILEGISKIDNPDSFEEIQDKLKNAVLWRIDEDLGTSLTDVKERYLRQKEALEGYIPTPWPTLNEVIGGGFYPKTLSSFVAGSSVGKSIALDQFAYHSWAVLNKNVISFTLELSEEMKGMRIDSHALKYPIHELNSREKDVENHYSQLSTNGKRFVIKEYPTSAVTPRKLGQFIHRIKMYSDFTPDVIVVDYADILLPNSGKKASLYEAGGEIFEQLRGLSYEFNCPVITATQFARAHFDKPPSEVTEFDVSESSKKMMTVDNLIAIVATPAMRSQGQAAFKALKARLGQKDAIVNCGVSYENFTFFE